MKEQVSALMDGELGSLEVDDCVKRLKQDPAAREAWDLYHLIGDTLRGHYGGSLPGSFSERLAQEPTVLAPRRKVMQRHPAWLALSAAASVAAVAAVGWMALPMINPQPSNIAEAPAAVRVAQPAQTQMLSVAPANAPAAVLSNVVSPGDISDYLIAHQRFTPTSAMVGVAPYARTVSVSQDEKR